MYYRTVPIQVAIDLLHLYVLVLMLTRAVCYTFTQLATQYVVTENT